MNNEFVLPAIEQAISASDTGYRFGFEDAIEGLDQQGSMFFPMRSAAWNAYNEGFLAGAQMLYSVTGKIRPVFMPEVTA